jgi:hypothetical protein
MITEAILNVFYGFANVIINLLPTFDISAIGGFTAIITSIVAVSAFMPVGAFVTALGVYVAFHSIKFTISLVNFVLRKVPTIS